MKYYIKFYGTWKSILNRVVKKFTSSCDYFMSVISRNFHRNKIWSRMRFIRINWSHLWLSTLNILESWWNILQKQLQSSDEKVKLKFVQSFRNPREKNTTLLVCLRNKRRRSVKVVHHHLFQLYSHRLCLCWLLITFVKCCGPSV